MESLLFRGIHFYFCGRIRLLLRGQIRSLIRSYLFRLCCRCKCQIKPCQMRAFHADQLHYQIHLSTSCYVYILQEGASRETSYVLRFKVQNNIFMTFALTVWSFRLFFAKGPQDEMESLMIVNLLLRGSTMLRGCAIIDFQTHSVLSC